MSRRELEREAGRSWEAGRGGGQPGHRLTGWRSWASSTTPAYAAQVVRYYSAKGYGERKLRDELYRRGVPRELWDEALEGADGPRRRH